MPNYDKNELPAPEYTESENPVPAYEEKEVPVPEPGIHENMVQFGDTKIELKPTLFKYQRDRTASFYRLLKQFSPVDLFTFKDGMLDPHRSSDKMMFDWLVAVTNDPKLVAANYDKLDTETIYKILDIFCRLNHIKDEEEKKDQAQMTNH